MIAVDTNVLLRRLLDDDAAQTETARRLFARKDRILIADIVLVETVWTLKGKRYKATREDIVAAVTALLEEPNVLFESRQAVWAALNDYAEAPLVKTGDGMQAADLADALVVHKAMFTAQQCGEAYEATYTFDQAALAIPGTKAP
jgi:predicted nucleic-acid-binding protein